MVRTVTALLLTLALLLPGSLGTAAEVKIHPVITVTGTLSYVVGTPVNHYELAGYVLLHPDPTQFEALLGQEVVVKGVESDEPSIFMRKMLEVKEIRAAAPADEEPDAPVFLPVSPGPLPAVPPAPGPAPVVSELTPKPYQPQPLFGTPFYMLFGQMAYHDGRHYLVESRDEGFWWTPLTGDATTLCKLLDDLVGAVVEQILLETGETSYRVESALSLTADLAPHVKAGLSPIFAKPAQPITVRVNGHILELDQPPILGNSRTLIGLRAIAESLGARVSWDEESRTAFVSHGGLEISVSVGSNLLLLRRADGTTTQLESDMAAVIVGGRTLLPVRILAESFGLTVAWDPETWTVDLAH